MTDAAIHRVSGYVDGVICSVGEGQWIATGYRPRDDNTLLSLRGGSGARDAAIHRVSEDVGGVVSSITEGQWIATGCRPCDDKGITFRLLAQAQNESNGLVYLLHCFGINLSHKFSDS